MSNTQDHTMKKSNVAPRPLAGEVSLQDVHDFFTIGKPIAKRPQLPPFALPDDPPVQPDESKTTFFYRRKMEGKGTEYVEAFRQQETLDLQELSLQNSSSSTSLDPEMACSLDELESESVEVSSTFSESQGVFRPACDIYRMYDFSYVYNPEFPITGYRQQILDVIGSNPVVIVQGLTGSGKSTQIPQYVLDQYVARGEVCNIVVTQPRRLAARSIALWVSHERGWPLGSVIGYQVGLDQKTSDDTRLTYMTTGILLRKLISTKSLSTFTHIFIDEVHERDKETDFLMLLVKKLLRSNSRSVKVILMSATISSQELSSYFAMPMQDVMKPAPVIAIEGQAHEVKVYFVDDIQDCWGREVDLEIDEAGISPAGYMLLNKLLSYFDYLEKKQDKYAHESQKEYGSVLVFLPGLAEITNIHNMLMSKGNVLQVFPLHSTMTPEEQNQVFKKALPHCRKVILATNIAESSITVPDIKYVVDFCLMRQVVCDTETNYQSLQLTWASKANCNQRKGRAGRTSDGRCYRLVTKAFWKNSMLDYSIPEMQRHSLESTVLNVKQLNLGDPKAILATALSPPHLIDIEHTILLLKEIGALTMSMDDGHTCPYDGEITVIGQVLAMLPLDLRFGKLIVLGYIFGCLEECLIIAAALSLRSFFLSPFQQNVVGFRSKLAWAGGTSSDCLAILNTFKKWKKCRERGEFRNHKLELQWGKIQMIQITRIREVAELMEELQRRLHHFNIRINPYCNAFDANDLTYSNFILQVVMAGAFYPFYFSCSSMDEVLAAKEMFRKDPKTTVIIKGLPPNAHLYYHQLQFLLRNCGQCKTIFFEGRKAYVEFVPTHNDEQQGGLLLAVLLALKLSEKPSCIELNLADINEADKLMVQPRSFGTAATRVWIDVQHQQLYYDEMNPPLLEHEVFPQAKMYFPVIVTEMVDVGHFWIQRADENHAANFGAFKQSISQLTLKRLKGEFFGNLCLAPFKTTKGCSYYRACIEHITKEKEKATVFFVDYGNKQDVQLTELMELPDNLRSLPFQAVECRLVYIRPSVLTAMAKGSGWSHNARLDFQKLLAPQNLVVRIFSVERGSLRVELARKLFGGELQDVGKALISMGHAEPAEETYDSKQNHSMLMSSNSVRVHLPNCSSRKVDKTSLERLTVPTANSLTDTNVRLFGPYSPYEMEFHSLTNIGRMRSIKVDKNSVNSVSVNIEPQDTHERLLLAAAVSVNSSGSMILLRHTTLMPPIHGLPAIVCALFTPKMELRRDKEKRRYTGALCGLGYDTKTGKSIFPDHDIEVTFDTTFDVDDLIKINVVRKAISIMLKNDDERSQWGPAAIRRLQKCTRDSLLQLFFRKEPREPQEMHFYERPYRWNQIPKDEVLTHFEPKDSASRLLYQLHNAAILKV
uniref:ATP-dependent RNA helicase TDRD9-like n=1 Tax=Myxine glutinosa TaxID=7769 RepID=UPI0035900AED